jgi:predicted kinase
MTARTYAELRRRARILLGNGCTVIVDASFARRVDRQAFSSLAQELRLPVWLLHLHCDRTTTLTRLERRQADGTDASDGRRELLPAQAAAFEPFDSGSPLIEIDSSLAVDYNVQQVLCQLLQG